MVSSNQNPVCQRGKEWLEQTTVSRSSSAGKERFLELQKLLNDFVTEKKLKRSDVRDQILEVIVAGSNHFTAQELVDRVSKKFPSVGQATVYRNLPVFVASGILEEGPTSRDSKTLYEIRGSEHHDHIVCLDCGMILEFKDSLIEKRQDEISRKNGFAPVEHKHVVYGRCLELK